MAADHAQQHYRWNFGLWVLETAAWMFATAFIDSTTVLPVLVLTLSGSPLLASIILSIRYAGQGWPQLIAASLVSGRRYKKSFYLLAVIPGRLALLVPAVLLFTGYADRTVVVASVLLAYLAFWISEGFSIVPWTDMVGKTIPAMRRGRLFAVMHVAGGILGIMAGAGIRTILRDPQWPFPSGYGVLFGLALVAVSVSTLAMALLREPPSPEHEERYSTWALVKDIPNLLRTMPQFRLLVLLQALFGFSVLPAPFYILYVTGFLREILPGAPGVESQGVGIFLAVQTSGMIVGNAFLGHIGDRYGNRSLLRLLAVLHVIVPITAIIAGLVAGAGVPGWAVYAAFMPTFFIFGGLLSATWMGVTNFLLELAPEHDRPAFIAVTNALNLPAIVLPLLGGLLLRTIGYTFIFLIAALVLSYTLLITRWLHDPRWEHDHPGVPPPSD
jgi:MFS family permease